MTTSKVLLIAPPYASLRHVVPTPSAHLGLLYLAAYARKGGVDARVMVADMWSDTPPRVFVSMKEYIGNWKYFREYVTGQRDHPVWHHIETVVKESIYDLVGITSTTPAIESAIKVAGIVKKNLPTAPIVLGGPHATLCPDEVLCHPNIDMVIRGEGEEPFLSLIKAVSLPSKDLSSVPALSYRDAAGRTVHNPAPAESPSLDSYPFPDWSALLLPKNKTIGDLSLMASRGCPYNCAFCADQSLWDGMRHRSVSNIIAELEMLVASFPHIREIYFNDGTLTFNRQFTISLANEIAKRDFDLSFYCAARFDNLNEKVLGALKSAGFHTLYIGAESGDPDILKSMNKRIDPDFIRQQMALIQKMGFRTLISILVGVPEETESSLKNTIALMESIAPDAFDVNIYIPLPGSRWYCELPKAITEDVDWLSFGNKSDTPYLFTKQDKRHLMGYISEIIQIADQRLDETIARHLTAIDLSADSSAEEQDLKKGRI